MVLFIKKLCQSRGQDI
jgi:hypothetical protein